LDPAALSVFPDLRPRPLLVLGGTGWRPSGPDHAVRRVDDLPGAVQAVLAGLGLDSPAAR
jgi:hypothetical protein